MFPYILYVKLIKIILINPTLIFIIEIEKVDEKECKQ